MKPLLVVVIFLFCVGGLVVFKLSPQRESASGPEIVNAGSSAPSQPGSDDAQLSEQLRKLCETSGGNVSVAVVHLETGKTAVVDGSNELPLYSVFKLPLAIAVLKNIEENHLKLDQKVHIGKDDVVPGWRGNTDRWKKPVDMSIRQMLELSLIESDNTSSEKLLQLVGGPAAVTERMRSFELQQIDIKTTIREYSTTRSNPNMGSSLGIVKLLARLQRGELLQPAHTELLIGIMERAQTGLHRLRANLPPGTKVADKTGSGELNPKTNVANSTNDVGLITLPNGRGHLAMAVLLRDSTLADALQEKLIADLARLAFDSYSRTP
jgi:beta-lactamase class A